MSTDARVGRTGSDDVSTCQDRYMMVHELSYWIKPVLCSFTRGSLRGVRRPISALARPLQNNH